MSSAATRMSHARANPDPSADDPPVERGDDRLGGAVQPTGDATGEAALQEAPTETRATLQPAVDVRGQVGAGAERLVSYAGQDGEAHVRVGAEVAPRLEQQVVGLGVDGVALVRPVERDVRDLAALLIEHLGHLASSLLRA